MTPVWHVGWFGFSKNRSHLVKWWDLSLLPSQKKGALWEGAGRGVLRAPGPAHSRCPRCALACRGMCGGQGTAPGGCGMPGAGLAPPCRLEGRSRSNTAPTQRGQDSRAPQGSPSMGPRESASAPRRSDRALSCYPTRSKRDCQSEGVHTSPAGGGGEANSVFSQFSGACK